MVEILDHCIPTSVITTDFVPDSTVYYTLGDSLQTVTFDAWDTVPSVCSLVYQVGSVTPALDVESDLLTFDEPTRTFSIQSSASAAISDGTYSVDITAQMTNGVETGDQITLFIEVQDVEAEVTSVETEAQTVVETPTFEYLEPRFVDPIESMYQRKRTDENGFEPISIGKVFPD